MTYEPNGNPVDGTYMVSYSSGGDTFGFERYNGGANAVVALDTPGLMQGQWTYIVATMDASGTGTVYTYTVVRHATHAALAGHIPYVIAIVELTEGPRIVTGITGCDPRDVRAGMPVRVRFTAVTDEVSLPYFEPVPAS